MLVDLRISLTPIVLKIKPLNNHLLKQQARLHGASKPPELSGSPEAGCALFKNSS
jgi:hypothetical protein